MSSFDIGIIGLGPAGLSVLQRLLSRAQYQQHQKIRIALFEPNPPGTGGHSPSQSHLLTLHSAAIQADLFPQSEYFIHHGCQLKEDINSINGLSFFQWCRDQKIKLNEFNQVVVRNGQSLQREDCITARDVAKTDCLPRYLVGEYLTYCYKRLMNAAPDNVECELFSFLVNDLELSGTSDHQAFIVVGDKTNIKLKSLVLTLGYTGKRRFDENKQRKNEIYTHYPLPCLDHIKAIETIAIEGMDLCALDVLSMLTQGRGGKIKFSFDPLTAKYIPSGLEPRIILFSRSGLLSYSRPEPTTALTEYQTLLFTPAHLKRLLNNLAYKVDFKRDVYPIICLEMRAIYVLTNVKSDRSEYFKALVKLANLDDDLIRFTDYLSILENQYGFFSIDDHMLTELPEGLYGQKYQDWCQAFLQKDIAMSYQGRLNPIKAALEVWHHIVPQLRTLIDFERLSSASKIEFFTLWYPVIKRTLGGAEVTRNVLFLETMKAGIVQIKRGAVNIKQEDSQQLSFITPDNNRHNIDYLVHAHLDKSGLQCTDSKLLQCLLRFGLINTTQLNVEQLDYMPVNQSFQLIDATGKPNNNLWGLGPSLEGLTYLNHHLPSTLPASMDFIYADSIAKQAIFLLD